MTEGSPIGLLLALTYPSGGTPPIPPAPTVWTKQPKYATTWHEDPPATN